MGRPVNARLKHGVAASKSEGAPARAELLRDLPDVAVHPLRLMVLRKGLTLAQAAPRLGWSLRTVLSIVTAWHRPKDAAVVAGALGYKVDELFPRALNGSAAGPAEQPVKANKSVRALMRASGSGATGKSSRARCRLPIVGGRGR
jgi:lambda repressor-like predicted transcriptional regulator